MTMFCQPHIPILFTLMLVFTMGSGGCDALAKKAEEVKKAATDTTQRVVENVKRETNNAGSIELALSGGSSVKTAGCYGEFIVVGHGRPAILKVKSNADVSAEAFPSLLFQATTPVDNPTALANQTLQGVLYFQQQPDGPVWHSADGETVTLSIQTAAEGQFSGTLAAGKLVNTETNESRTVTGSFSGSLK
jgi:hypothetical protein